MNIKKPIIVTGLDIGSSKVSAVAAQIEKDGTLTILGEVTLPSRGISKGVLVSLNEAVSSVSAVLKKLRAKIARPPENIYVNISGDTLKGAKSKGMAAISLRGREVTGSDMERCVNAAGTIHLPFDREIIHRIVHGFSIDDQHWIKNPMGLYASRLNCEVYIITANVNQIQNLYKCVNNAGYDIKEVVFTGIADGSSLLDKFQKEEGAVLLDIGASLTESSIFSGGVLQDFDVVAANAENIQSDFRESTGFKTALSRLVTKIEVFTRSGGKVGSVTVTGGMAFTDSLLEALEEALSRPVKMGSVRDIRGEISGVDSVRLSTSIGLVKYAHEKYLKALEEKNVAKRLSQKVVDIFNNYF